MGIVKYSREISLEIEGVATVQPSDLADTENLVEATVFHFPSGETLTLGKQSQGCKLRAMFQNGAYTFARFEDPYRKIIKYDEGRIVEEVKPGDVFMMQAFAHTELITVRIVSRE